MFPRLDKINIRLADDEILGTVAIATLWGFDDEGAIQVVELPGESIASFPSTLSTYLDTNYELWGLTNDIT